MNYETMAKGFLNAIKDYGDIQAEQAKIKSDIMANEFKARNNFLWKMQEKNYQTDYQKKLGQMFEQQQGGANQITPQEDVFAAPAQPRVEMGTTGYVTRTPNIKEAIFRRLQLKKQKGYALSPQESAFEQRFLGGTSQGTQIRDAILQKVVDGKPLSIGEQKIYNDVIKRSSFSESNLFPESPESIEAGTAMPGSITEKPALTEDLTEIQLPPNITTTSQAKEYLMTNHNMAEDEAISWIQEYTNAQ